MESAFQSSTWLVTGGTGLLGSTIIDFLTRNDIAVMALVRSPTPEDKLNWLLARDVKLITGDLLDTQSYASFLPAVDVVCHAAAVVNEWNPGINDQVNYLGTRDLLKNMIDYGVKRLIFISTAGVYDRDLGKRIDETSQLNPLSPYTRSKLKAEEEIMNNQDKIDSTIIRPPFIIGDIGWDRHVIPTFLKKFPRRFVPQILFKDPSIGFVHAEDIARLVLLAGSKKMTRSLVYNVQSFEIGYREIINYIEDARHSRTTRIKLPYLVFLIIARMMDMTRRIRGKNPIYSRRLKIINSGWVFSTARAQEELGWQAIHHDKTELLRLLSEYAEQELH